jgi:hypothetical protein
LVVVVGGGVLVKGFGGRGVNWVLRELLVTFAQTMEQSYAAPDKRLRSPTVVTMSLSRLRPSVSPFESV